jgi:hypothetical protein
LWTGGRVPCVSDPEERRAKRREHRRLHVR